MHSSNPFPQLPSSTVGFSHPNSFFYHEKDDVQYNYHRKNDDPFISGEFLFHPYNSSTPPAVIENVTTIKQDFVRQQQFSEGSGLQCSEDHDLLDSVISPYNKRLATSKRDGHSKIYTARGPRDRRVRLSIEISRKFFCLQDLLGFDKPSQTLDWLFSKSLTAINELVEETSCSSSTVTDQSKLTFLETINGGSEKKPVLPKCVSIKKKKTTRRCNKSGFQEDLARDQCRTEARARARERTREKLLVKKLDDDLKTLFPDCCDSGNFWSQTEPKNEYKDICRECIMDQEPSMQSKTFNLSN
ncbi:unnamed protein product [Lactuca saligna]|uniref:Cycloidea-like protein n=1 Tax=Lactuca saligna TaxID=75948 RepID=A0AA35Y6S3_LACSI|nr:unnamed protein product [Lactuca saligna]